MWCLLVAVSKAFSTLSDGNKRAAYDRYGDTEGTVNGQRQHAAGPNFNGEGFDPEEIFNMFFNGGFGGGGGFGARYTLALRYRLTIPAPYVCADCKCIHYSAPSKVVLKLEEKQRLGSGSASPRASTGQIVGVSEEGEQGVKGFGWGQSTRSSYGCNGIAAEGKNTFALALKERHTGSD